VISTIYIQIYVIMLSIFCEKKCMATGGYFLRPKKINDLR